MYLTKYSAQRGLKLAAALTGTVSLLLACTANSQSDATAPAAATPPANGQLYSDDVLNLYVEMVAQRPAQQISEEEKDAIGSQLTDLYLLATQAQASELRKNPRVAAQLELQENALLAQEVARDFIAKNVVTEEDIKAAYDAELAKGAPKEFKARHILVETQSEASDLIKELDGGANFAELAKQKSTGPSGPSGGDLGWFTAERMVPEFSAAVAALEDGAYSPQPVQTQFGWHVILREESRDATPPTLESMRDAIKQALEQQKLQDYIESLRPNSGS